MIALDTFHTRCYTQCGGYAGLYTKGNASFLEEMEQRFFFPFVVHEIQKLHAKEGFPYKSCAALISDRYQAHRLGDYLQSYDIPFSLQRSRSLAESPACVTLTTTQEYCLAQFRACVAASSSFCTKLSLPMFRFRS